jgi:hypothetical protein
MIEHSENLNFARPRAHRDTPAHDNVLESKSTVRVSSHPRAAPQKPRHVNVTLG